MKEIELINRRLKKVLEEAGGEEGIHKILTSFYEKLKDDILVGFFFDGKDLPHIIEQQKYFLLRAMGAKVEYRGKSPARAHDELPPILKGHFDRRLVVLKETLEEFGLSPANVATWVEFEDTFRDSIVKEEQPLVK